MCSPAPIVVSQDLKPLAVDSKAVSMQKIQSAVASASLRQRLHDWMHGLKQTFIAELASLGLPKERF
jgi:hypothetical protein